MGSALALSGCSSEGGREPAAEGTGGGGQVADTERMTIALITHAAPGDTFWDIVRKGAETAAKKDNVELLYTSDPEGGRQAQLIAQAVDQGVDGIAVTLAKPDALKSALKEAEQAGIPVVSLNAGEDSYEELGAFTHFGQNEEVAGEAAGEKLKELGKSHPVCVIQEQGHVGLEARCAGVKEIIPETEILYVQGTDMTQVQSTVTAKLQTGGDIDSIIGLGAPFTMTILQSVEDVGSDATVASFDLNSELAQEIVDGNVAFTVDQQPFVQGYMAIDSLWLNNMGGFTVGGGEPVLTGPAVVDQEQAEEVLQYAEEGLR
ncbi:substrate-binding domain-containing protein [Arthrobacter sp. H14]|uniref:substrate-binding domain-containing protein n=1 Tax=Arthrobacter sp. H14 TaxID=1312959 RepID=UPI0006880365|nr:substrate-binding domain-containing protein [Arthrobacter sp. H14]